MHSFFYKIILSVVSLSCLNVSTRAAISSEQDAVQQDWKISGQPFSEHFDTVNIAANPQNYKIKQDEKGYIYVANGAGILIFDGNRWELLEYADQQTVRDLVLAKDGKIYLGTIGDLGYFAPDNKGEWKFTSLIEKADNPPEVHFNVGVEQVNEYVVFLTKTHLFYYHPNYGLNWFEDIINPVDMIQFEQQLLVSTSNGQILTFDPSLSFSLTQTEHLASMPGKERSKIRFTSTSQDKLLLYTNESLYRQSENNQWIKIYTDIEDWLSKSNINDVINISNDRLAIATTHGGIAIIDQLGHLLRFINTNHGLKNNAVSSLLVDRQNNIWAASGTNGVSRVELDSAITYFPSEDEFFLSATVTDFQSRTFMGAQRGLFILQPTKTPSEQAKFTRIEFDYANVMSLVPTGSRLLIGHEYGIDSLKIDKNGKYNVRKILANSDKHHIHVRDIILDRHNSNIAYAISINGLLKLKRSNGVWQSVGLLNGVKEPLFSIHQEAVTADLWVGSPLGQFFRISDLSNWPNATIQKLNYPQTKPPMDGATFMLDDKSLFNNGVDQGFSVLSNDKTTLKQVTFTDVKKQDITGIMSMIPANDLETWFLAWINNMGMDRVGKFIRKGDGTYDIDFSELDRLRLEFTLGIYQNQQGVLWINSKGKVVRYDPKKNNQNTSLFSPVVSQITEIGNEQTLFNHAEFKYRKTPIQLEADQKTIQLDFTAADYAHAKTSEFRYRLTSRQTKWSDWQAKPSVIFTNLEPGEYNFELQYRNNPNSLSPIFKLPIHRLPYWYQSILGRLSIGLISFLLLFIIAWGIARVRIKHLHLRASKLESQVTERTLVIEQKNKLLEKKSAQLEENSLQLEQKNMQLKQMDQAKNRFFTNVSHEFRTPLSLAIGPLKDVIAAGRIKNQKDLDYLKISLTNNLHIMELLSQVLDINKLEANGMPISVVNMDLATNLQYCIQRFQLVSKKQSISFKTIGFENSVSIYFDADHFEKIVLNLLSNAVKFSPPKSQITLSLSVNDKDVQICVIDQGIGINPQDLPHIFERFYQGQQSSQTIQPGTGIGLSLVKELITLHQGKISVESELSKGARFCLTILRGNEHYEQSQISEQKSVIPSSLDSASVAQLSTGFSVPQEIKDVDSSHKTVLVIDDNADLRAFIRSSLESTYNILEADNGRTGLQSAQDNQPDLIVSDIMMPVMDGLQLTSSLKANQQTAHIPLILLTAKSTKRDIVEGLQQGADDYLSKPFDSAELAARIASQLTQKQRVAEKLLVDFALQSEPLSDSNMAFDNSDDFENKINQLIISNMGDEMFDVKQMYESLNITRSTLFRQVKKVFSCTPNQLLKLRRLQFALAMLQQNKGSISEIGYAVGFQSLSVFSRAFSDQYRVPPSRFNEIKPI